MRDCTILEVSGVVGVFGGNIGLVRETFAAVFEVFPPDPPEFPDATGDKMAANTLVFCPNRGSSKS
jgi:hypothetical protein